MSESRPYAIVVAGPNGSGKSTLTNQLREGSVPGISFPDLYINADDIERALREKGEPDAQHTAFDRSRQLRATYRESRLSYAYEVVRIEYEGGYARPLALPLQ